MPTRPTTSSTAAGTTTSSTAAPATTPSSAARRPRLYFAQPTNNGDVLRFGLLRGTEFADYDEFSPRPRLSPFVLDFSSSEGRAGERRTACTGIRRQPRHRSRVHARTATTCSSATSATTGSSAARARTRRGAAGATTSSTCDDDLTSGGLANDVPDTSARLRGSRLRRRGARRPDRQHRRRSPDRLDRRVQQLSRAVRAVRRLHGESPGAAVALRVPLRPLEGPGRGPDTVRRRHGEGAERRAARRDRPDHPAGRPVLARPERRPKRSAAGQHPRRPPRRPPRRGLQQRPDAGLRARQRRLGGRRGALQVAAASLGKDAAAVYYLDRYLPVYYEIRRRSASRSRPAAGRPTPT